MSDPWDPSLYDPTDAPADGRVLIAAGGRTGTLELENGAKLRFPWKSQQQITGSVAPRIQSYETDSGGQHTLGFQLAGSVMNANAPTIDMTAPFPDETDEPSLSLSSGGYSSSDQASIILRGHATLGRIELYGQITGFDALAIDSITNRVGTLTIDSSAALTLNSGGALTLQPDANQNLVATTTGTGDINLTAGDDINMAAGGDVVINPTGTVQLDPTGTVQIQATGGDIVMGTGSSSITIGNASSTVLVHGVNINGQWASYTPTLTQSGTVTKTVTYSRYQRIGRLIRFQCYLAVTASGTANNPITVSLPETAAQASLPVGTMYWYDASAGVNFINPAWLASTTTAGGLIHGAATQIGQTQAGWPNQLASGDAILFDITYEASS